ARRQRLSSEEAGDAGAATLARLLHLEAGVTIEPIEQEIPRLDLYRGAELLETCVSRALDGRAETGQLAPLHAAADEDLKVQRYGWFIPSVSLNSSAGNFG